MRTSALFYVTDFMKIMVCPYGRTGGGGGGGGAGGTGGGGGGGGGRGQCGHFL